MYQWLENTQKKIRENLRSAICTHVDILTEIKYNIMLVFVYVFSKNIFTKIKMLAHLIMIDFLGFGHQISQLLIFFDEIFDRRREIF